MLLLESESFPRSVGRREKRGKLDVPGRSVVGELGLLSGRVEVIIILGGLRRDALGHDRVKEMFILH